MATPASGNEKRLKVTPLEGALAGVIVLVLVGMVWGRQMVGAMSGMGNGGWKHTALGRLVGTGSLNMPEKTDGRKGASSSGAVTVETVAAESGGAVTGATDAADIEFILPGEYSSTPEAGGSASEKKDDATVLNSLVVLTKEKRKTVKEEIETVKLAPIYHLQKAFEEYDHPYDYLDWKVFRMMEESDVLDGIAMLSEMDWNPVTSRVFHDLIARWSDMNPQAAAEYVMGIESRATRGASLNSVLRDWAEDDPGAAYNWLMKQDNLDQRAMSASLRTLFSGMADHDLSWALSEVWNIEDSSLRGSALRSVAGKMMEYGYERELKSLYGRLTDIDDKVITAQAIVSSLAAFYPQDAANWLYSIGDVEVRDKALNNLVYKWGYDQPSVCAEWVSRLPDPEERSKQMSKMASLWAQDDPFAAAEWLGRFPPSEELDPAVRSFVGRIRENDPGWAMDWTHYIVNEKQRTYTYKSVVREWAGQDKAQARAYVNNSGFPEDLRNELLQIINEP